MSNSVVITPCCGTPFCSHCDDGFVYTCKRCGLDMCVNCASIDDKTVCADCGYNDYNVEASGVDADFDTSPFPDDDDIRNYLGDTMDWGEDDDESQD